MRPHDTARGGRVPEQPASSGRRARSGGSPAVLVSRARRAPAPPEARSGARSMRTTPLLTGTALLAGATLAAAVGSPPRPAWPRTSSSPATTRTRTPGQAGSRPRRRWTTRPVPRRRRRRRPHRRL